jgi:hypothetical protein
MIVPNGCLPALAWLQAAEALQKCELWTRALAQDGDEGRVRSGLELVCRQAWEQLGRGGARCDQIGRGAGAATATWWRTRSEHGGTRAARLTGKWNPDLDCDAATS